MKRKHPACQRRWLCPVDPLDLTGLENWLTECSEQGLHFAQYVPLPLFPYWRFACGEPQTLRYRLEPIQRKGPQSPDPEGARQELFLQTGSWVIHVESCTFDLQLYAEALCEQLSTL